MSKTHDLTVGAALLTEIVDWMQTFIAMPREHATVAALFAIHSHVYQSYDACPYLSIVAATKQAGKTTLLETVAALSKGGSVTQNITEPTLFAKVAGANGDCMIGMDEFELRDDDMAQTLNGGYRSSGLAERVNRAYASDRTQDPTLKYRTYCMKAFACIGDLPDTLRDRSIVVTMRRDRAERKYRYSEMMAEATRFRARIDDVTRKMPKTGVLFDTEWLFGRDEEIWSPLFTTAHHLGCDDAFIAMLTIASKRMIKAKSAEALRYTARQAAEDSAADRSHSEDLVRDILKVCAASETRVWTATLIERLHTAEGWDTFRGTGLTPIIVSELLSPLGVAPRDCSVRKGKTVTNRKGYDIAAIRKLIK